MNLSRVLSARLGLLLSISALAACSMSPMYREVRTPAPGGGYYIQRIPLKPGEKIEKPKRKKKPKPAKVEKPAEEKKPAPQEEPKVQVPGLASEVRPSPDEPGRPSRPWWKFWARPSVEQPAKPVDDGSYWVGDGVAGKPKIVISLGDQVVRYYKGGELVGLSPMSSGREGYTTVAGTFAVSEKDEDHKSSLYGNYVDDEGLVLKEDVDVRKDPKPPGAKFDGADMRWFMRITGAIGMHEGYLPGFPASHGCIRLPSRMAEIFYNATPYGTLVEIVP